jgi:ABC-type phosphate transport system auxiliary subunit
MAVAAVTDELQEQLLAWEEKLTQREEALAIQEEKARISNMALVKVSADLDAECAETEATHHEYLDKMQAHTAHAKHTLILYRHLEGGVHDRSRATGNICGGHL